MRWRRHTLTCGKFALGRSFKSFQLLTLEEEICNYFTTHRRHWFEFLVLFSYFFWLSGQQKWNGTNHTLLNQVIILVFPLVKVKFCKPTTTCWELRKEKWEAANYLKFIVTGNSFTAVNTDLIKTVRTGQQFLVFMVIEAQGNIVLHKIQVEWHDSKWSDMKRKVNKSGE